MQESYALKPYRWVVLISLVPVIVASEICWLTFAPIATMAEQFFGVSSLSIALFSMSYMIMYILFALPASWIIDKYGFMPSVAIGAVLTAIFAAARYFFAGNFAILMVSQFMLAAAQPFLVNVSTKVPANWFAVQERSTAAGVLLMAQYIGFIIPMIASPLLSESIGMVPMLGIYGAFAVLAAALSLLFAREKPDVLPGPPAPVEDMSLKSLKNLLRSKAYIYVLAISFISMGLFNTLLTMIEKILQPRGFSANDAGIVGAAFVVTGIIGAVVVPLFSDKIRRRTLLFVIGIALIAPLCLALTFFTGLPLLIVAAALLGFVIMGLAPILFQHGAEVAYPVAEGASFGFIMLMGQISGAAFVYLFDAILAGTGSILYPMLFLIVLAAAQIPVSTAMKESERFLSLK